MINVDRCDWNRIQYLDTRQGERVTTTVCRRLVKVDRQRPRMPESIAQQASTT